MTFETLTAEAIDMRAGNEDVLTGAKYDDDTLVALNQEAAKRELKADMQAACSIEPDDTETLDAIVSQHQFRIQLALAHKQVFMYYKQINEGVESKADIRMRFHEHQYEKYQATFAQMRLKTVSQTQFLNISR